MSRLLRLLGALVALGVVASVAIGGCLPAGQEGVKRADPPTSAAAARRAFLQYAMRAETLVSPRDQARLPDVMSGPIAAIAAGELKIDAFYKKDTRLGGAYDRTAYWLPRKTAGPPWFVASGARSGSTDRDLVLFARTAAGKPFTAAYALTLEAGTPLPRVGAGRVGAVPVSDDRLAAKPGALATMHANIEQYGPMTPDARAFEPSAWTTTVHTTGADDGRTARKAGYIYYRSYHDSGYPAYALRTASGGALVFYAVLDELSVSKDTPSAKRAPLKLTKSLAGVVGARQVRSQFQAVSVRQYVAYDPPRGRGKVRVLASDGGPVGGVGR